MNQFTQEAQATADPEILTKPLSLQLAERIFEETDKAQSEQGDLRIRKHANKETMNRRLSIAADLYAFDLKDFITKHFEILPYKSKTRLGFPTRLFSHLFTYRFMQDSKPSDFYQLGEKRVTDPRFSTLKHTDNSAFVIYAMKNTFPDISSMQVNCPHSINPKAKKKVNPYTQIRCFDRLVMKEDSEFLNSELTFITNNPSHFLNPLVESWLMKKLLVESGEQSEQGGRKLDL